MNSSKKFKQVKPKTKMERITSVVVWLMLFAMLGTLVITMVIALKSQFFN
ncbi:DUF4044 domain-containing protein [Atopobacter sp. AH10]|nr:DUF4044 domain-containing protein [Atopobacter sp. AH10]RLK63244.1 DUF4044 domain-containing protein [Atopobacter sp. AH10]